MSVQAIKGSDSNCAAKPPLDGLGQKPARSCFKGSRPAPVSKEVTFHEIKTYYLFDRIEPAGYLNKQEAPVISKEEELINERQEAKARLRDRIKNNLPEPKNFVTEEEVKSLPEECIIERLDWVRSRHSKERSKFLNDQIQKIKNSPASPSVKVRAITNLIAATAHGQVQEEIQQIEIQAYQESVKGLSQQDQEQRLVKQHEEYAQEIAAEFQKYEQKVQEEKDQIPDLPPASGLSTEEYNRRLAAIRASRDSELSTNEMIATGAALIAVVLAVRGLIGLARS